MSRTMVKKAEKTVKDKTPVNQEDLKNKTPEPYQCTGHFKIDFEELGKESNFWKTPPVMPRPKVLLSTGHASVMESSTTAANKRGGKEDKKAQQQKMEVEEELESQEDKEIIEFLGFKPKTFMVKKFVEVMRPCIHVEQEHPDKHDTVTEIFIKGWQVDQEILKNLSQCYAVMSKLHTLNFWRVGFTSQRVTELADVLSRCENIKALCIEANEALEEENYHELIRENSNLTKLRLRFCHITSSGGRRIAEQLGTIKYSNTKLVSLDLSSNKLGNQGALHLAQALRTNRTLIYLSLSGNNIGDEGCIALAQTISRFFLTHEEILERRQMLSLRNMLERGKSASPPTSRKGDGRPGSVRSTDKDKGKGPRDKSSKAKKQEPPKDDKNAPRGKKEEKPSKKAATIADPGKNPTKGKAPKGNRASRTVSQAEMAESKPLPDSAEINHPLMENVEPLEGGRLLISGNCMLILLNLSRNQITEAGLQEMLSAMQFQRMHMELTKVNGTGMMKVMLRDNVYANDCELLRSFEDYMASRDPSFRGVSGQPHRGTKSPDTDSHHN